MTTETRKKISLAKKQERAGYLFLAPSLLILSLFVFWPIVDSFWLSLHKWNMLDDNHAFIGLKNYLNLIHDDVFWKSVVQTVYFTIGVVPLSIVLGLGLALLCNGPNRSLSFFKTVYFLPVITSFAIIAIIWGFLLDPDMGLISYYLSKIGLPKIAWLRDPSWAMIVVILVAIWKNLGFNMVLFLSGLQNISPSLYEAAKMDGANSWERLLYVTLPSLRHTLLFVLINSLISSFQVFDQVYVMTRGGPENSTETIVYYIYHQGFELYDMGYASSIAWFLTIIVFIITVFQLRIFKFNRVD